MGRSNNKAKRLGTVIPNELLQLLNEDCRETLLDLSRVKPEGRVNVRWMLMNKPSSWGIKQPHTYLTIDRVGPTGRKRFMFKHPTAGNFVLATQHMSAIDTLDYILKKMQRTAPIDQQAIHEDKPASSS